VKANKTLSNLKKASAALAIIMKLLARFFSQLSSRFVGWLTVSQRPQCSLEDLPQEAEEARNRENEHLARIQEDNERRNRENERLARIQEDNERRNRENERLARIQEDNERRNRENERLARIQEDDERRNRENECLNREAASRLILERAKTLNQVDAARAAWGNELQRSQHNRGLDGPSIER
jgi:hypothetical protein